MKSVLLFLFFVNSLQSQSPTQQEIYDELTLQEVIYPKIVLQQAIIETNCGKTGVGRTQNNIFGFRNKNGYKHYKTWKESITDYKSWQTKNLKKYLETNKVNSEEDYYNFICWTGFKDGKRCSSAGQTYIKKLKSTKISIKI